MKQDELQDQIKGHIFLKHYLQAFLVQTAYIEGLIKIRLDYTHFAEVEENSKAGLKVFKSKFIQRLRKELNRQSVSRSITILKDSEIISPKLAIDLQKYFKLRNIIIHDLVNKMGDDQFNELLQLSVALGGKIMKEESFKDMIELLRDIEKSKIPEIDRDDSKE